jgi:hypothetical protein
MDESNQTNSMGESQPVCSRCGGNKVHNKRTRADEMDEAMGPGPSFVTLEDCIYMIECDECHWVWPGHIEDDGLIFRHVAETIA